MTAQEAAGKVLQEMDRVLEGDSPVDLKAMTLKDLAFVYEQLLMTAARNVPVSRCEPF